MINIFDYMNFREYIRHYYKEKKERNPSFSYQVLALKAGFKSKSYIADVISGRRNLTDESMIPLGKALGLKGNAFAYFESLIAYNQAKTHTQKSSAYSRLTQFSQRNKAKIVVAEQYEFYSKWYHNTIRELAVAVDFKENYAQLAQMLTPPITPGQAKESVNLLLKLGLLKKTPSGYKQADAIIRSGEEVKSVAISTFHLENLKLASSAIDVQEPSERDISCVVASLSPESYAIVKDKIRSFHRELLALAETDDNANRVFHINMQLFPTSKTFDCIRTDKDRPG